MRKSSYILYHLSNCAPCRVLLQAYYSLAESYIRHGITARGNVRYNSTLQKTQESVLKVLWKKHQQYYSIDRNNVTNNMTRNLNIMNVKNIYYTTIIKEFDKDSRFLHPIDHMHNTRRKQGGRYKVERFTNEYGRNTMSVIMPTILNKIPITILNINNKYKKFKEIKKYLINL